MPIVSYENTTPAPNIFGPPYIHLGRFARVVASDMAGNNSIGDFSCISRSQFGRYSGFNAYSFVSDCVVGRYCTFGSRVSVGAFGHPTDWLAVNEFQYRDTSRMYGETLIGDGLNTLVDGSRPTKIGSDVWIGDNATVSRGVVIGAGSIIGISAVVLKDVEPYSIVVGNPGRVVRKRFADDMIAKLLALKWWDHDMQDLRASRFRISAKRSRS